MSTEIDQSHSFEEAKNLIEKSGKYTPEEVEQAKALEEEYKSQGNSLIPDFTAAKPYFEIARKLRIRIINPFENRHKWREEAEVLCVEELEDPLEDEDIPIRVISVMVSRIRVLLRENGVEDLKVVTDLIRFGLEIPEEFKNITNSITDRDFLFVNKPDSGSAKAAYIRSMKALQTLEPIMKERPELRGHASLSIGSKEGNYPIVREDF